MLKQARFEYFRRIQKNQTRLEASGVKLEAQWAAPVSFTFHSDLRKLNTEPSIGASHQIRFIWLSSSREDF